MGRERLHGKDKEQRRGEIFERSGGRCEVIKADGKRCENPITWFSMHWSHDRHAANKDDSVNAGLASCQECHLVDRHNGGKPVPRKPGRTMNLTEAKEYWEGECCFCEQPKKARESFCPDCLLKVSPQIRHDLQNADDPDVYRDVLARAEIEILTWRAA